MGGGIDSWGHLTLRNTTVSGNTTGPAAGLPALASDSDGAGIYSQQGSLLLEHVRMSGNRAIAAIPDGRFAEGGAVFAGGSFGGSDRVTVLDSVVSGNRASLTSDLPGKAGGKLIDMNANSGGIHVGDHIPTTVERTAISGNSVSVRDLRGEPVDFDPGMLVGDSRLTMRDSVLAGNRLFAESATSAGPGPAGNVLELDGPGFISNTRITDNTTVAVSPHGLAGNAGAGLAVSNVNNDPRLVTVQGGVISGNTAIARTSTGTAPVQGVGVLSESLLTMTGVLVSRNTGRASRPAGFARGGGIWHGFLFSGKRIQLTLNNTVVTRNVLTGRAGIKVAGGGLFSRRPVTLNHVLIAANIPDQCVGCR